MSSTKRFETDAKAADLAPGLVSAAAFSRASASATISRETALDEAESTWMHGAAALAREPVQGCEGA